MVHSATEFIGGHGTAIGGVIVDGGKFDWAADGKYPWISEPNPSYHGISFSKAVGAAEAQKFIDNLEIFSLLANVADVKSLVIHPASTTHSQLNDEELAEQGIKPNTIRLSIGIENSEDLIEALDKAFAVI